MRTQTRSSSARPGRGRSRRLLRRLRHGLVAAPRPPDDKLHLYYFDDVAADRAVEFIERYVRHTKGEWAGQPFILEPWQKKIVRSIFGWKRRADGLRRYRTVYIEIPRKNGKSMLAAAIALCALFIDGEPGAEVYSLANDRTQARIVFDQAKEIVRQSPALLKRAEVYVRSLVIPSTLSKYEVLSADVEQKHGLNPHVIVFDELHVQDDRDMWDTMRTGMGARRQPLTIAMTTAGFDLKTLCGELHNKALAILDGRVEDDAFLPIVYGIRPARPGEKQASWEDPKVWAMVNPNLGVSVKLEYLKEKYREAKQSPAFQNSFRRLHCNEWVRQVVRWIDMTKWAACTGPVDYKAMRAALAGRPCFGALDLSTVTDLSAFVALFDSSIEPGAPGYPSEREAVDIAKQLTSWEYGDPMPSYDVLPFFWCPEEGIKVRSKKDQVSYDVWRDAGALIATEGDAVDHGAIRKFICDFGKEFPIQEIGVDAWNAHKLVTELEQEDGFTIARVSQGFGTMTTPTKELDALYRRRQIRHGGHPVLAWCADNASLDKDSYDNWKPSKKRSRERIDGIVALVMALSRALVSEGVVEDARIEPL